MYSRTTSNWLKHWDFMVVDLLCLECAFLLAYILRHGPGNPFIGSLYQGEALILLVSQLLVVFFSRAFSGVLRRGYYLEFIAMVKHAILVMVIALVLLFVEKETGNYSRIVLVVTGAFYIVLGYFARLALKSFLKNGVKSKKVSSLVVVITKSEVENIVEQLKEDFYQQYAVKGICLLDEELTLPVIEGHAVLGGAENLIDFTCREWVDEVLFLISNSAEIPQELLDTLELMGIVTHVPILTKEAKGSKRVIGRIGDYTVLTTSISVVETRHMIYKRMLDIIGGIVGCLITLLLIIFIGPLIYLKSPGPIFFSQTRIGKNGRRFKIYKFRSMYMDAEERKKELMAQNKMSGHMFKLDYDPRIIGSEKIGKDGKPKGIGNFIRATSIDEFPQFWNVLKGDMSLVGTRPPTVDEWEQYEPHHRARMAIKPGITGMWQVSGRSDITDFEEVVALDKQYIEEWNPGLDIKILFMTVIKVFKNDGAV